MKVLKARTNAAVFIAAVGLGIAACSSLAFAEEPAFKPLTGVSVRIVSPKDGETVPHVSKFVFEVKGATLKPAGSKGSREGHLFLMVDGTPVPAGYVESGVSSDRRHLAKGETETMVELSFEPHNVTVQLFDGQNRSYGPAASYTVHNLKVAAP
jgi:Domain of unknown function (DUF4399)